MQKWQPLAGAIIAIVAAAVAFLGVRTTQRVNIMLREEDRIERALPGSRQAHDLLSLLLEHVKELGPQTRYLARELIRGIVRPHDNETFEAIVRRLLPLADPELQRDLTSIVFRMMTQADMLKVVRDELDRANADLANIADFASSSHAAVRAEPDRIAAAFEKEYSTFASIVETASKLQGTLAERIKNAEERRNLIRETVGKYFREW